MKLKSYKDLISWQKSILLVEEIYLLTSKFPAEERFGIISQLRRAAISISSNIAEGYGRKSVKEYLQFYSISYGSALEIETQLIIAKKLRLAAIENFVKSEQLLEEVSKMLYTMVFKRKEEMRSKVHPSVSL